jgi:hypothetical protein
MHDLESSIHWRPWSVAIVLALFIAVFSLTQFNLLQWSFSIELGCAVLFTSVGWNIYVLIQAQSGKKPGWNPEIADGLLLVGLILIFLGAFF